MSYLNDLNDDIYYITEVEVEGEKLYMFTKRVAVHFPDMGKKFLYKRSAKRYYTDSEFEKMNCKYRILKYSRYKNKIIEQKQTVRPFLSVRFIYLLKSLYRTLNIAFASA